MKEIKSAEDIRDLSNAFRESRILLSAFELKIFSALDHHMMTSEQVSKKINAEPRATDRLMNALCAMGLLKKVHGKFYNTDLSSKYLVEGKPEFMGNLYHTNHLWHTWSHLTESVMQGSSFKGDQNKKGKDDWVEAFISAMHYRGVSQGKILAMMIDLSNVKKVLDVGEALLLFQWKLLRRIPLLKLLF